MQPRPLRFAAKSGSCANRMPFVAAYSLLNPSCRAYASASKKWEDTGWFAARKIMLTSLRFLTAAARSSIGLDVLRRKFVDILAGIGIHKARIAFHVAAIGQIENDKRAGTVLNAQHAVIVHGLVGTVFAFRGAASLSIRL